MDIYFSYEGSFYKVGFDAYSKGRIVLPDGRAFDVIWDECGEVPCVRDLVEFQHNFSDADPHAIAHLTRAELAVEV